MVILREHLLDVWKTLDDKLNTNQQGSANDKKLGYFSNDTVLMNMPQNYRLIINSFLQIVRHYLAEGYSNVTNIRPQILRETECYTPLTHELVLNYIVEAEYTSSLSSSI
jgi:hypothetical protein